MGTNKYVKQFGLNVRQLRLKKGWTQATLAQRAEVTPNFIGFVERGERNITLKNALMVANGLGCPIHKLFKGM